MPQCGPASALEGASPYRDDLWKLYKMNYFFVSGEIDFRLDFRLQISGSRLVECFR